MAVTMISLTTYSNRTGQFGTAVVSATKVRKVRESLARDGVIITHSRPQRAR